MTTLEGFSEPLEIPDIPDEGGVAIIEDERGRILQVIESTSIRRRIGELLNTRERAPSVHGARVYEAQKQGTRIFVRWKLTPNHKMVKKLLVQELNPLWKRKE
jgi:hypothetical protein